MHCSFSFGPRQHFTGRRAIHRPPRVGVLLSAMVGTVFSALPTLLPQELAHRRDVWRDMLRHRERMAHLRIKAAEAHRDVA